MSSGGGKIEPKRNRRMLVPPGPPRPPQPLWPRGCCLRFRCASHSLVAGGVALAAAQRDTDDAAGERHIQAVGVGVYVQREHPLVVLVTGQASRNQGGRDIG